MAKNRVHLSEEVEDLETNGKKHFSELHKAKEGQRKAEADLANIERCIKRDQEDFQTERDKWAAEKIDLIATKDKAVLDKLGAEAQTEEAPKKVAELMARLAEVEKFLKIENEWFVAWRESKACETVAKQVGSAAQKMGEDDALKRMKTALAKSHPSFSWDEAMASYKVLADAEDQSLLAELNIALSEDESDEVEEGDPQPEVARSEELTGSSNEQADHPAA